MMQAIDAITPAEAYDAMRIFLETVWQRHGRPADEIAFIMGGLKWADGSPVDLAMWEDWLAALRMVRIGQVP